MKLRDFIRRAANSLRVADHYISDLCRKHGTPFTIAQEDWGVQHLLAGDGTELPSFGYANQWVVDRAEYLYKEHEMFLGSLTADNSLLPEVIANMRWPRSEPKGI